MTKKELFRVGLGAALLVSIQPLAAEVTCIEGETLVPVAGKIFNNAVQPGMTLGTVHAKIGRDKLKCGIVGQGGVGANGSINFVHTFVCDDQVLFPPTGDTVHSQLTLSTTGFMNAQACPQGYPPGSSTGTFVETSVPVGGTGRGIFTGVERGELQIDGTVNCLFAIDMSFSGSVCLKNLH